MLDLRFLGLVIPVIVLAYLTAWAWNALSAWF